MYHLIDSPEIHVILVGTGTPIIVENRSGPCTAIMGRGEFFLFDVGPGTYRNLVLMGLPVRRITAIIFTHYHSDHIGDLGEVMTFSWVGGRDNKLPVYGPIGIEKVVQGFQSAYDLDSGYRYEHHKPLLDISKHGFQIHLISTSVDNNDLDNDSVTVLETSSGIKIIGFEVNHAPVIPAFGYRIECDGSVIVISGDTCKCDSLIKNSLDCDILVQEVICCDIVMRSCQTHTKHGNHRQAQLLSDVTTYHTDINDCVIIANESRAKVMLLTHIVPGPSNSVMSWFISLIFQSYQSKCNAKIVMGEDGMIAKIIKSKGNDAPKQKQIKIIKFSMHSAWIRKYIPFFILLFLFSVVVFYFGYFSKR